MEIQDLDRIRFVTRHFHDLQGLRLRVPVGLAALGAAGMVGSAEPALVATGVLLFLGAFALMLAARRYYAGTFGEVERQPVRPAAQLASFSIFSPAGPLQLTDSRQELGVEKRLTMVAALAVGALLVFQLLFWPPWIKLGSQVVFEPAPTFMQDPEWVAQSFPAPLLALLCGAFFLAIWLARERGLSQSYHLALGLLLLALSVSPPAQRLWLSLLSCGAALVLAGLLDHRQLVRFLGRVASGEGEEEL